jgi:acyl-CoA hydrolase
MDPKPVSASRTTQVQILMPCDINGYGRLFGGKLMEWIDVVGAVVARRHSGRNVTTAEIGICVSSPPHIRTARSCLKAA